MQCMALQAVKYQSKNLQAWNLLGLCQTSMGDIGDGIRAYQKVIDLQTDHREAWVNMAQARKEVSSHDFRALAISSLINLQQLSFAALLIRASAMRQRREPERTRGYFKPHLVGI